MRNLKEEIDHKEHEKESRALKNEQKEKLHHERQQKQQHEEEQHKIKQDIIQSKLR
jgi:hypothetical protein